MVFEHEDLEGLSKKELKNIIIAQSKTIERLRQKTYTNNLPHRDMSNMDVAFYNPHEFGKLWFV